MFQCLNDNQSLLFLMKLIYSSKKYVTVIFHFLIWPLKMDRLRVDNFRSLGFVKCAVIQGFNIKNCRICQSNGSNKK